MEKAYQNPDLNVVEENLGLPLRELENYNGKVEDELNETIEEKTDREIYDLDATSISIVSPKNTITFGEELIMSIEPSPFTSNPPTCVWETSDPSIAYVREDGIIMGGSTKGGDVIIIATNTESNSNKNLISATKTITVINPKLGFTVTPNVISGISALGETKTITIVKPESTTLTITKDEVATEMVDSISETEVVIKANTGDLRTGVITFKGEEGNTATLTLQQDATE